MNLKPPIHGFDHRQGGYDPIELPLNIEAGGGYESGVTVTAGSSLTLSWTNHYGAFLDFSTITAPQLTESTDILLINGQAQSPAFTVGKGAVFSFFLPGSGGTFPSLVQPYALFVSQTGYTNADLEFSAISTVNWSPTTTMSALIRNDDTSDHVFNWQIQIIRITTS